METSVPEKSRAPPFSVRVIEKANETAALKNRKNLVGVHCKFLKIEGNNKNK
jgi:hypothetical protein